MKARERQDLIAFRLEQAEEKLASARLLLEHGQLRDSVSRAYYAMFSAGRALLVARGVGAKSHSGVVAAVGEHFVKTGELSRESGRRLTEAKDLRHRSDYADFVSIGTAEAEKQLEDAVAFVEEARQVLARLLAE